MNNLIDGRYQYFAFISYKREDERWAKWLQHELEHYKLPSNLNGRADLPKEIRPVFRDTSELTPGNLPEQIRQALEQSKYLIVVCSPRSANSEWVNKEIEYFISIGRTRNVIPFIVDGKAFSKDIFEECFPLALRKLPQEQELLGANINEMGRDAAAVKVVARMFDIRFDELWQRHEREKKRRKIILVASVALFVIAVVGVAFWMYLQRQETLRANWKMMENQARMVAEKSKEEVKQGHTYDAIIALLELLPDDGSRPFVPELEEALRTAYDSLRSHRWNVRYFNRSYDLMTFAGDDRYIVCEDDSLVDIYESKNLHKTAEFKMPENLRGLPSFLSSACDSIFVMDTLCVWCYSIPTEKLIKKMDYTETTLDMCMNACCDIIGYQEWPWIKRWMKNKGIPDNVVIRGYNPRKQLLLYSQEVENTEFDIQSYYMLYDCKKGKIAKVLDNHGKPFSANAWIDITSTSFSPDGGKLAIAYMNGKGIILDLDDYSEIPFDCGNSDDCAHYSNVLTYGRNGQILHTSIYDSFKIFDGNSLALVDSVPSFFSDAKSGMMNSAGNICMISDTDDCFVWYLNEKDSSKDVHGRFIEINKPEDNLISNRFNIFNDEDGALCFEDRKGEYKSWRKIEKGKYLEIKGYFQDYQYMVVTKGGFRDAQYGSEVIDVVTGTTVYHFPSDIYYVDHVYYNSKSEQMTIGNSDGPFLDSIIDFPSFKKLVDLCKKATEGMELSNNSRRLFYLD
ncbi:MAG: toll/interleukin-1 receptor domain-containing protein [Prevotella sp.]|nr:toll/interleukin-1 receptor domain-containing protein [Prevotella sp.]